MIISQFPSAGGSPVPEFTYTGSYAIETDSQGWKIKFFTSGTFTFLSDVTVDIFAVGGGGGGLGSYNNVTRPNYKTVSGKYFGAGGGGGYTSTEKNVSLTANTEYAITVGNGSAAPYTAGVSSFANLCSANGGKGASPVQSAPSTGGNGGSGGASECEYWTYNDTGAYFEGKVSNMGGTDGGNGVKYGANTPGTGQGTTTREFGEANGKLYASGGGSYSQWDEHPELIQNSGNGGFGGYNGTSGASGIVIIRNARA